MQIRIAELEDLPNINQCISDAFCAYVERMRKKPQPMIDDYTRHIINKNVYVLHLDDLFGGFIVLLPRENHLYLDTIAVNSYQQGKGLGKELMQFAEKVAIKLGLYELQLCTNVHMNESQHFYSKVGFIKIERKIVNGYDRIYYRKELTA